MEFIELPRENIIGRGYWRRVFRHPENSALCIKTPRRRDLSDPTGRRAVRYRRREIRDWQRHERRGCDFARMPRYHGRVLTQFGISTVWDLMLCANGEVAPSLESVLQRGLADPRHCRMRLLSYGDWAIKHCVIGGDLQLRNLVCRFDEGVDFDIAIVDGWENPEAIPISNWLPSMARRKTERRWHRFLANFDHFVTELQQELLPLPAIRLRAA